MMHTLWSNFYIVFTCWQNHIKLPYRNTSAAFLTKIPSSWSYQKIILVSYYIFFVINIITRQNHCIIISVTTYTINGITGTTEQHTFISFWTVEKQKARKIQKREGTGHRSRKAREAHSITTTNVLRLISIL